MPLNLAPVRSHVSSSVSLLVRQVISLLSFNRRYHQEMLAGETQDCAGAVGMDPFQAHDTLSFKSVLQLSAYSATHYLSRTSSAGPGLCFIHVFELALAEARQVFLLSFL